jgi:hypothetical protein
MSPATEGFSAMMNFLAMRSLGRERHRKGVREKSGSMLRRGRKRAPDNKNKCRTVQATHARH